MYISTIEGRFLHCNQSLMGMLKYNSMEEMLTLDIEEDLYIDVEKRRVMLDHIKRDGFFDPVTWSIFPTGANSSWESWWT